MIKNPIYINGIGVISIQEPLSDDGLLNPINYNKPYVRCLDPKFKDYINPMVARRMSPIVKRAIVTAKYAVKQSGIDNPDAIITGTGLGCVQDTEKFLDAMIRNEEKFMQPAFFIQSTHNTISSQIAINLGCKAYNNTFIHRGVSFENALFDALLQMNKPQFSSALVTGSDEMTPSYFKLLKRLNYWKDEVPDTLNIVHGKESIGSFATEGSVSFMLAKSKTSNSYAKIVDVDLKYMNNPDSLDYIVRFLKQNELEINDVDVLLTGMNGDVENDNVYKTLFSTFGEDKIGIYRNVCGEFYTSSAYGLYAAATCINMSIVPKYLKYNFVEKKDPKIILIYNHFKSKDYSLILLKKC